MSFTDQDNVTISITTETHGTEDAEEKLKRLKDAVESTAEPTQKVEGSYKELDHRVKETGEEFQVASSPIRAISWDLLLTGRSLSIMNTGLLGSNQAFKTAISVLYSVASAIRMVVMAYDFQRIAAENAAKAGYMSTHFIPKERPFDVGARIGRKDEQFQFGRDLVKLPPLIPNLGKDLVRRETQFVGGGGVTGANKPEAETGVEAIRLAEVGREVAKVSRDNKFASRYAQSAEKSGVVQSLSQNYLPEAMSGQSPESILSAGTIGGLLGTGVSAFAAPPLAPFIALLGGLSGVGMSQFEQGGTISKDGPIYAHKGEAMLREKDFYAVNQILGNFNRPIRTDVSQNKQPSVALPGNTQNVNNSNSDLRSFTNITMNTGPISSNIDVNNILKKMAQAQTTESRRRMGQ